MGICVPFREIKICPNHIQRNARYILLLFQYHLMRFMISFALCLVRFKAALFPEWNKQTKQKKKKKKTRTVRFPWRFWLNSFRHIFEYFFDFYFVSITLAVGTYFKWNYLCMCILMSLNTDFGCFFCVWASVESMLNAMSIGFRWNNFRRLRPFSETMFMTTEILSNHHIQSF